MFLESDSLVIVRIKDRFVEKPSQGGWRDLMINFHFKGDPNRHICEVQVVLGKMLVARKGLGGHHGGSEQASHGCNLRLAMGATPNPSCFLNRL